MQVAAGSQFTFALGDAHAHAAVHQGEAARTLDHHAQQALRRRKLQLAPIVGLAVSQRNRAQAAGAARDLRHLRVLGALRAAATRLGFRRGRQDGGGHERGQGRGYHTDIQWKTPGIFRRCRSHARGQDGVQCLVFSLRSPGDRAGASRRCRRRPEPRPSRRPGRPSGRRCLQRPWCERHRRLARCAGQTPWPGRSA
ncbi:hypothetical protein D3C85_811770 [compost metagenome]